MKTRKAWVEIAPPNGDDYSSETKYYQRVINLPYSHWSDKVREIINRWIESAAWTNNTRGYRCGHDYDCCGCQFAQSAQWTYSCGKLTLSITKHFNY